jgi:predicted MFS family arabinose efflux permease
MSVFAKTPRLGTALVFLASGAVQASLFARLPALQDSADAGTAALGTALAVMGAGTFLGMCTAARHFRTIDDRQIVAGASGLTIGALVLASFASSPVQLTLALLALGVPAGMWDARMNVHAAVVERRAGRHLMTEFHGLWSLGCVIGAGVGVLAASRGWPVLHQSLFVGTLALGACLFGTSTFVHRDAAPSRPAPIRRRALQPYLAHLIGIIFLGAIIEGAAGDWLAVLLADERGQSHGAAASGYLTFVAAMAIGRLGANRLYRRYPEASLGQAVLLGTAAAAVGVVLTAYAPVGLAVHAGAACWGLGICVVFPGVLSVAGRKSDSGRTVALLSSIGYAAGMVGPIGLGLAPSALARPDLRLALVVLLPACAVAAVLLAWLTKPGSAPVPMEDPTTSSRQTRAGTLQALEPTADGRR